ncbi:GNAT family N-acetyltransferase, partial [Staphylococcus hominis]
LCFMIWEDMELDIVNEISQERIMNILELSIVNVEYRSYYKNVWVYEVNGKVAGCVIAYDGKHELDYEKNWLKLPLDEDIRKYG